MKLLWGYLGDFVAGRDAPLRQQLQIPFPVKSFFGKNSRNSNNGLRNWNALPSNITQSKNSKPVEVFAKNVGIVEPSAFQDLQFFLKLLKNCLEKKRLHHLMPDDGEKRKF